jgi:hypothetical protein
VALRQVGWPDLGYEGWFFNSGLKCMVYISLNKMIMNAEVGCEREVAVTHGLSNVIFSVDSSPFYKTGFELVIPELYFS